MRTLMGLALAVFFLAGCSFYETDYRHSRGYSSNSGYAVGGSYGGNSGYSNGGSYYDGGGTTVYATNNYNYYYPFGNVYYPRNRIWLIYTYGGCDYYSYRGYCYRYRDDYDRVIIWDRQHGYNDHWYSKRQDWCRRNNCYHDDIVRDGKGRPIKPVHVERDGMQRATPQATPRTAYPVYNTNNSDRSSRGDRYDRDSDGSRDRGGHSRDTSSGERQSVERQPVERYAPAPVYRSTERGARGDTDVDRSRNESQQPVIRQQQRPVFTPRNENSGWGGSAGGRASETPSRNSGQMPRSEPSRSSSGGYEQTVPSRSSGGVRSHDGGGSERARDGSSRQRQSSSRGGAVEEQ
ncbi:MAG: hypothetical protein R3E67_07390 [Pseudomonadales bacterium]